MMWLVASSHTIRQELPVSYWGIPVNICTSPTDEVSVHLYPWRMGRGEEQGGDGEVGGGEN